MTTKYTAIVNAVIPPITLPACMRIHPASWEDVVQAISLGTPHYIRHPSTAKLLGAEPSAGFFAPQLGDVYLALRLKSGTAPRGTEVEVSTEQLEILSVEVLPVE